MKAENINSNNEMLHNLRLFKQKMRLFIDYEGEGKRARSEAFVNIF